MPKETKIVHKELQRAHLVNCPNGYRVPYLGFNRIHRFYVPDVPDEQVVVNQIYCSGRENFLSHPVALLYLNNVLKWFEWPALGGGSMLIGLERLMPIMYEGTEFVDPPLEESLLD